MSEVLVLTVIEADYQWDDEELVVKASDYDQLKEKLAVTTDCADAYSRMFEEVSEDRERVMAERDTLRKQLDEARELLEKYGYATGDADGRVDAWLEANK